MKPSPVLASVLLLAPLAALHAADTSPTSGQPPRGADPVDWVDPFIGTQSARWFFFTPAAAPFGLVKLAPDTTGFGGYAGGGHTTGYRFSDTTILGFSHLHDFQVGGVLLMPATGPLVTVPGADGQDRTGWRSRFLKSSERAEPGYYRVHLDKHDVSVELTASTRVGCHRYTFPKTDAARVLMDVGHLLGEGGVFQQHDRFNGGLRAAMIERVDDRTVRACCTIAPPYAEAPFDIYAEIRFNRPFKTHGAYRDAKAFPGREVITGFGAGYYVEFDTREEAVVEARVGISHVGFDGARKNLATETEGRTFDQIRAATRAEWNRLLGRVIIEDERPEAGPAKVKFYTALWHVLLGRGVNSDADGACSDGMGRRGQVPLVDGRPAYARYNSDALWGSFWNLNQVWSLLYPEQMTSFAKHLLASYRESGWLPDGFVVNRRAPGMLSNQATVFLAAAYARNPAAFDREELWNAIWKNQTQWRERPRFTGQEALTGYSLLGYAPCDDAGSGAAGYTLEYAFEDWCVAQLAAQFGKKPEADFLTRRADAWQKLWDEETRCFRPRRFDGSFHTPFDPHGGYSFIEGTALQYRWFVPHNIPALVRKFTPEVFLSELSQTLAQAEKTGFGPAEVKNTAGLSLPYNHGNQPGLHTAWLFHFAGRPDLSRQYVRSICERFYGTTPLHGYGLGQDEDQGQLGAWYVLAAMGMFDVEGMVRREAPVAVIPPAFARMVLTIPRAPFSGTKAGGFRKVELRQEAGPGQSEADAFVPLHTLWEKGVAIATNPPPGASPTSAIAQPSKAARSAAVPLEGKLSNVALSLDIGKGIRLQRIGDKVLSSGGRMFSVLAGGRKIQSDEVSVTRKEVVATVQGWTIPFSLPDGLGAGTLRFSPSGEPGVISTSLELTNGGPPSTWRVLFPLVEGAALDGKPAGDVEFFFPFQEGWLGKGETYLSIAYGHRAWLPVLAAWNPCGTGISVQMRDKDFDVHSMLLRSASPGGKAEAASAGGVFHKSLYGESYHPDKGGAAAAFPLKASDLTLGVATLEFPLGSAQTWKSKTFAIQTYDGKGIFKTPLASYGKWARAAWWKHRPIEPGIRDMFLAMPVHERGGGRGVEKGFWDGKRWILAGQVETFNGETGGHLFPELCYWWNRGDEIKSGPFAGRLYPHTHGDYEFEPRFGGAAALRAEVERVHQIGGRVCLYVQGRIAWKKSKVGREHAEDWAWMDKPGHRNLDWSGVGQGEWVTDNWNFCPQAKGWQEHLSGVARRILIESGADALRLDSMAEILFCHNPLHEHAKNPLAGLLEFLATIRKGVEAAGPDKTLWGEFCGSDAAAMFFDGTLAQGSDPKGVLGGKMGEYGISPFRFVYPEVKCIEWGHVPTAFDYLSKRFLFNGVGITVGDVSTEQLRILARHAEVMRSVGDVIGSMDCEPIVPTRIQGVLANRFTLGDREIYTLWNRSAQDSKATLLSIPGKPGRRFVELLSGRHCQTARNGSGDDVELALPSGEVAVIGAFPKIIESQDGALFTCPATFTMVAVEHSTGKPIASGVGKLEVPKAALSANRLSIRALEDGYLVQDLVEVSGGEQTRSTAPEEKPAAAPVSKSAPSDE